jgi:hypothetical protein
MAAAIVVTEAFDGLRMDLDLSGRGLKRRRGRIIAKSTRRASLVGLQRQPYLATFPERLERRCLVAGGGQRLLRRGTEKSQPFLAGPVLGEFLDLAKTTRDIEENS